MAFGVPFLDALHFENNLIYMEFITVGILFTKKQISKCYFKFPQTELSLSIRIC